MKYLDILQNICRIYILKAIKHEREIKEDPTNGEVYHVHGFKDST